MTVHDKSAVLQLGNLPDPTDPGENPSINAEMADDTGYGDYYGFSEFSEWFFPDGKQKIEFKKLNEGERARFQKATSKSLKMSRSNDEASLAIDQATDRHELIKASVTGWFLVQKRGEQDGSITIVPLSFSKGSPNAALEQWLVKANPKLIDDLHAAIIKANPFMQADVTVEMIDEEIEKLQKQRAEIVERDAGKSSS